jgi:uncharacterized protein YceK
MKALFVVIAVLALAGCGERVQVAETGKRGYQGKQDAKPWENEPLAYGSAKWTKGDRGSWETHIKARQLGQHEDKRIYQ